MVLQPVLGSSPQHHYGHTGGCPAKGHKGDEQTEALHTRGKADGVVTAEPGGGVNLSRGAQ